MSNVCSLEFFLLFQSLLEENRASNKSSPFISFFGHSGCVSPWLKPKVLSFPFDSSAQGFFLDCLSFFLPSGVHEMAIFACLVLSILNTCTNHFHLLSLIAMSFFPFRPFVLPPHLFPFVASISECLPIFCSLIADRISFKVGFSVFIRSNIASSVCISANAGGSGLFRTSLKCSFQRDFTSFSFLSEVTHFCPLYV